MNIRIHRNGINYGPYSESSVRSFLEEGTLSPTDLAWTPGRTEWTKLESLLGETGVQSSNPSLSSEDKENIEKIRGLVGKGEEEFALDLVRGLGSEEVVYALLEDWRIDEESGSPQLHDWASSAEGFFLDLLKELPSERADKLHPSIVPSKVRKLSLRGIEGMKNLDRVKIFPNLEALELDSIDVLSDLEALAEFSELTSLKIENCSGLAELESLDPVFRCRKLTRLALGNFDFQSADFLSKLTELTDLSLEWCSFLKNLDGLESLTNLRRLGLRGCSSLVSIDALENLSTLTQLDLTDCSALENIGVVPKLAKLVDLRLRDCSLLESLHGVDDLPDLRHLELEGTEVPMEECKQLEESERFDYLSLPNGSTIEKFPESEDSGGALPRIEFYLGGYGLEAHEGTITEAQYAYWKDRSEDELIEHCEWNDYENENIPEDARLGEWYGMDDISACYGCQDGTLDVTEFRKLEDGWLKKYQPIRIEGGDSEDGDVKVHWVKCGRVAPTGPSFQGFSSEKGMYFNHVLEGKTFDPSKLELFSKPVFGGAQGDAINRIDYDGEELEFCPETDNKGYYFEIMPSPEEE